ncbi:hypothetical protein [Streptomyces caatingaensis]|uniref:Uncharacterized protein n=1 Tax=Streptomyces caatingaensis TaxID=1678637 RepID=A0A0K9XC11_9ACTN|nr:hypothetical protein [Streptomyces caatingaensis]KNB50728.1 hypothetical protein AC230_19875 [Streptomyces caatingaensis]
MDGYVMTCGRSRGDAEEDLGVLGEEPPRAWWHSYAGTTDPGRPTLLVEADADGWRAYLGGIPTGPAGPDGGGEDGADDGGGAASGFALAFAGGPGEEASGGVVRLVARWLEDLAEGRPDGPVSACLRRHFPAGTLERLRHADPREAAEETRRLLARTLADVAWLPAPGDAAGPGRPAAGGEPPAWIGTVHHRSSRERFVLRVEELLSGAEGRALLLNRVGGPAQAPPGRPGERLSVLTDRPAPALDAGPVALAGGGPSFGTLSARALIVAGAVVAVGCVVWVLWMATA